MKLISDFERNGFIIARTPKPITTPKKRRPEQHDETADQVIQWGPRRKSLAELDTPTPKKPRPNPKHDAASSSQTPRTASSCSA